MPKQGSKKLNVVPLGKQQAKQPRGEAVRVKLLDAAEALLLEQDAHQLRLNDVLADAGVARNTLYKHFKDLETLQRRPCSEALPEMLSSTHRPCRAR